MTSLKELKALAEHAEQGSLFMFGDKKVMWVFVKDMLSLLSALEKYEEALKEIAIPSSLETSGNGDIEEYESLYEFWHEKAYSRLNLAKEALTQVQKIMEGK